MNAPVNVLHHYAWEESAFPVDWMTDFNFYLQGMSCLSTHVEKIMRDNGIAIPLITSGCGVDHWAAIEADTSYKLDTQLAGQGLVNEGLANEGLAGEGLVNEVISTEPFRFLHVSSCFPRKGVDVLLAAYGAAFTRQDPVVLIIKTFANPHNTLAQQLEQCRQANADYPAVHIIEQDLSNEALKALYQQCDIMVCPSRAEGFGLPMAEAMLSNMPVITTGWGGQLDFCNTQTAWLIDYDFVPARSHFPVFDSVWAEPRVEHLTELLQTSYHSTPEQRQSKVTQAQALLARDFQWRDVVARHRQFAEGLNSPQQRPHPPRIAWVTTWNTKCGIAAYARGLVDATARPPALICANTTDDLTKVELLETDGANVRRNWSDESLNDLHQDLCEQAIDVVLIQFNYFFFDYQQLAQLIDDLRARNIKVLIELHSTTLPPKKPCATCCRCFNNARQFWCTRLTT